MSLGAWLRTPVDDQCGLVWPRWVPLATTVCAVAIAVAALAQRGALVPPGAAVAPALIAVGPWLAELAPAAPLQTPCKCCGATAALFNDPTAMTVVRSTRCFVSSSTTLRCS